jgi:hypothetical protein
MNINNAELHLLYEDFIKDETLIGIKNLLNKHGIVGRYKEDFYKERLYESYGEEYLKKIFHNRLSNRTSDSFKRKSIDKIKSLEHLAEQLYAKFLNDESICGLTSLFKTNKIGSKTGSHIRKILYGKYGKENIDPISSKRSSHMAHKKRTKESYLIPEERRKKMIDGIRKSWKNSTEKRRELSKKLMLIYCSPKSHGKESNLKRVESRKWYKHTDETKNKIRNSQKGKKLSEEHKQRLRKPKLTKRTNFNHSIETKRKLSEITRQQWIDGIHKPKYKSKGHIEIMDIISEYGYKLKDEYIIDGRPYDIFVVDKNLVIEFNGTYWHRDPRFYNEEEGKWYWNRDREKIDIAKKKGYNVTTIWQYDWEKCNDKKSLIKEILNGNR